MFIRFTGFLLVENPARDQQDGAGGAARAVAVVDAIDGAGGGSGGAVCNFVERQRTRNGHVANNHREQGAKRSGGPDAPGRDRFLRNVGDYLPFRSGRSNRGMGFLGRAIRTSGFMGLVGISGASPIKRDSHLVNFMQNAWQATKRLSIIAIFLATSLGVVVDLRADGKATEQKYTAILI